MMQFYIIIARDYIIQRRGRKFHLRSFPFSTCHCKNQHLFFHSSRQNSNHIWWNWTDKKFPKDCSLCFFFLILGRWKILTFQKNTLQVC